jgi:hypothetical protein
MIVRTLHPDISFSATLLRFACRRSSSAWPSLETADALNVMAPN